MQKMLDALGGPSSSALYRSVVAAVEDTLTALDYLLDRAEELYIDPDRIVLIRASAGGGSRRRPTQSEPIRTDVQLLATI